MYEAGSTTKVCFIVSKEIEAACWFYKQYGPNVAILHLQGEEQELTIINTYNSRGRDANRKIQVWEQIDSLNLTHYLIITV